MAGPVAGQVHTGKHGYPCKADVSYEEVDPNAFQGLIVPGGFSPDRIRRNKQALKIVEMMNETDKTIAFICHGGWVPISAKILRGKKVTGAVAIKDDLENAGAIFLNEAVVVDGNLISSRSPADLPQFCQAVLKQLGK